MDLKNAVNKGLSKLLKGRATERTDIASFTVRGSTGKMGRGTVIRLDVSIF